MCVGGMSAVIQKCMYERMKKNDLMTKKEMSVAIFNAALILRQCFFSFSSCENLYRKIMLISSWSIKHLRHYVVQWLNVFPSVFDRLSIRYMYVRWTVVVLQIFCSLHIRLSFTFDEWCVCLFVCFSLRSTHFFSVIFPISYFTFSFSFALPFSLHSFYF